MEMLSEELNLWLSQGKDSLMNIVQLQIGRATNSAINDRVILEIQIILGSTSFGQRDTESGTPTNNQDIGEKTNVLNSKLTKKDTTSAFDLGETGGLGPYMVTGVNNTQQSIPDIWTGRIHSRQNLQGQEPAHNVSLDTRQHTP